MCWALSFSADISRLNIDFNIQARDVEVIYQCACLASL